jgi:hypothetical protein
VKPNNGPIFAPLPISEISPPMNGAVQEKETIANVNAMKNIPDQEFKLARLSVKVLHLAGSVNSNAPRNAEPKIRKIIKKKTLVTQ